MIKIDIQILNFVPIDFLQAASKMTASQIYLFVFNLENEVERLGGSLKAGIFYYINFF